MIIIVIYSLIYNSSLIFTVYEKLILLLMIIRVLHTFFHSQCELIVAGQITLDVIFDFLLSLNFFFFYDLSFLRVIWLFIVVYLFHCVLDLFEHYMSGWVSSSMMMSMRNLVMSSLQKLMMMFLSAFVLGVINILRCLGLLVMVIVASFSIMAIISMFK